MFSKRRIISLAERFTSEVIGDSLEEGGTRTIGVIGRMTVDPLGMLAENDEGRTRRVTLLLITINGCATIIIFQSARSYMEDSTSRPWMTNFVVV